MDDKQLQIDFMAAEGLALEIHELCMKNKIGVIAQALAIFTAQFAVSSSDQPLDMVQFIANCSLRFIVPPGKTEKPTVN